MADWSPDSWKSKPIKQRVAYPDSEALDVALDRLHDFPPLVTSGEIINLKRQLALASKGRDFILQGGDCNEKFADCRGDVIASKLKVLLMMSYILAYGSQKRIIRIGRIAGQYAKPRSTETETRDGVTLPSYRGDLINRPDFTPDDRRPNPQRLIRGYEHSALTLNFIRGLVDGGFADLHHPEAWDLKFVHLADRSDEYGQILDAISSSVRFMENVARRRLDELTQVDFFTSHEGLHLDYETAQTREVPRRSGWYNLNTHMPWIGDRTRQLDGAHIEYFRGIENPIGMKVGPTMDPNELLELIDVLNPNNSPGRLVLIHRFGADEIGSHLPQLLRIVRENKRKVVWSCDPMHGNTRTTESGIKTRSFDQILSELKQAFEIHCQEHTILGGVHIELTGEQVTECTGGARGLTDEDLNLAYLSDVDPRLNYEQAMEMALSIARFLKGRREENNGCAGD